MIYDRWNDSDSSGSSKYLIYCRLMLFFVTVTVYDQKIIIPTADLECFSVRIAVAWDDFAGYYCHQTAGKRLKLQYFKGLFLFLLSVQKNQFGNGSMRNSLLFLYCHFMPPRQSRIQKERSELLRKITPDSTNEKYPASYCLGNSRKFKRQALYCQPFSRPTVQMKIIPNPADLPTVTIAVSQGYYLLLLGKAKQRGRRIKLKVQCERPLSLTNCIRM